jgi:hypothetical protein
MAPVDIGTTVPPDDSGSDTFARYCYQAHVALPYLLACAFREAQIVSIILEHFEDIAIEYSDRWRFVQIKTRDPGLGPWRLSDLLVDGGALRSLHRTFTASLGVTATYEAHLEGAAKNGDPILELPPPRGRVTVETTRRIAEALRISESECVTFLQDVRVFPGIPLRVTIVGENLRLLGRHAPNTTAGELERIHERVVALAHAAMAAERLADEWPLAVRDPNADTLQERIRRKRLTAQELAPLVVTLRRAPRVLLRRLTEPESVTMTELERKLLAGGAPPGLVSNAKQLRASASIRRTEYLSASFDPAGLEDLQERVRIRSEGLCAQHSDGGAPAVAVWNQLLSDFQLSPASYDQTGVFSADPFLLLGEVCELADGCVVDWGISDA